MPSAWSDVLGGADLGLDEGRRIALGSPPGLRKDAPGACVARTCATSFALVRKRRSSKEVVEQKERRPVGLRARAWWRMRDEGVCRNPSEVARVEGVSTAAVSIALGKLRRRAMDGPA